MISSGRAPSNSATCCRARSIPARSCASQGNRPFRLKSPCFLFSPMLKSWISLPSLTLTDIPPDPPATQRRVRMVQPPTKLRVLVVEDDADNAESLALLVRLWGHDVQICRTGAEALKLAPRYAPQAVLLDIGLPGMSGWEVARRIRGPAPVVLIGLSGFGMQRDRQRASEEGLDHFLIKPADPEELEQLLRRTAERAAQHTSSP